MARSRAAYGLRQDAEWQAELNGHTLWPWDQKGPAGWVTQCRDCGLRLEIKDERIIGPAFDTFCNECQECGGNGVTVDGGVCPCRGG